MGVASGLDGRFRCSRVVLHEEPGVSGCTGIRDDPKVNQVLGQSGCQECRLSEKSQSGVSAKWIVGEQ